jgi:uncharacterized protein YkwD
LTWFQKGSLAFLLSLVVLTMTAILLVYFGIGDSVLEVRIVGQPPIATAAVLLLPVSPVATATPPDTATPIPTATLTPSSTATPRVVLVADTPTRPRPTVTSSPSAIVPPSPPATPTLKRTAKVASAKIPASSVTPAAYDAIEARTVTLVNQARQAAGLAAFTSDPALDRIARARSRDMVQRNYFSHEDPAGGELPLEKLLTEQHIVYQQAGENIAYFLGHVEADALPELSTEKWMQSPPHKENMMDPGYNFTGFGIARAETAEGTMWYLTQVFVQR